MCSRLFSSFIDNYFGNLLQTFQCITDLMESVAMSSTMSLSMYYFL